MNKKLYLIIVNYNSLKHSIELIHSIYKNNIKNFQIIIIENCSKDDSAYELVKWLDGSKKFEINAKYYDKRLDTKKNYIFIDKQNQKNPNNKSMFEKYEIILSKTEKNLGFAGANNFAINNFINLNEDSNIFFVNPDICLHKDAIYFADKLSNDNKEFIMGFNVMDYFNENKKISIGGSQIDHGLSIVKNITKIKDANSIDYIYGGAMFTNTKSIRKMGLFPEDYFLYWEEADLCMKARKLNIPLIISNKSFCYDKVGQSIGRGELSEYLFTYNSFIFYQKYFKRFKVKLILKHTVRLIYQLINLNFKNARGIIRGIFHYLNNKKNEHKPN